VRVRPTVTLSGLAVLVAVVVLGSGAPPATHAVLAATASPGSAATPTPRPAPTTTPGPPATLAPDTGGSTAYTPHSLGRRPIPAANRPPDPESLNGYVWPVPNGRLTQFYGPSTLGTAFVDGQRFHDGIDLASWCGGPVRAAHDGVVLAVGREYDQWIGWRGDLSAYTRRLTEKHRWSALPIVIVIDDRNGYRSVYVHFLRTGVQAGDVVRAGQVIGAEGATGYATGCHLHYTIFSPLERAAIGVEPTYADRLLLPHSMTARIDPLRVLPPLEEGGIRLLP